MRTADLRHLDLNLLLVFELMLRERKVSRVAEQLGVTQPAVSRSLKRLRELLGDELFFRSAEGMSPTAYAQHLAEPVCQALDDLRQALSADFSFDPSNSQRTFVIAMSDLGESYILPRLVSLLSRQAPGIAITVVRDRGEALHRNMVAGTIDLAIGLHDNLESGFFAREIYRQNYVCVFRHGHRLAGTRLTLDDFSQAEHAVVTASGYGHAQIDSLIDRQGIQRTIRVRLPNYASLENLLFNTDLIATVPAVLVQPDLKPLALAHAPHPVQLPHLAISAFWHERNHRDPGNRWLREQVALHCSLPPPQA